MDRGVLVADGAMGTMLYARGVFINRCFDELNLSAPRLVREVHQAYVRAGADLVETNTFGANRMRLAAHGLAERMAEINREGARLARASAPETVYVAGSIGPLGVRIEPWGPVALSEARQAFAEQARALLEGGVDLFILETFVNLDELEQAVAGVREASDLPVVAQLTVGAEGVSLEGTPPESFVPRIEALGVGALGLNCGLGPQPMLEALEQVAANSGTGNLRLSAMPNAGLPRSVEGRKIYLCSPEYMASYARRYLQAGVKLVGGCCGTTPEHILAIKRAVREATPARRPASRAVARCARPAAGPIRPRPMSEKSALGAALETGRFVTGICLTPPRGWDVAGVLEFASRLSELGVDCVEIPEDGEGAPRVSSIALAALLGREVGLEGILDYSSWGRHLVGMQADLLGAHALGVRNLLARTGEPPGRREDPDRGVRSEVDAIGLTNMISRMNEGHDIGGNSFGTPTGFCIGVAATPTSMDLARETRRFHYKVKAGAEFAVTTPLFDIEALRRFLTEIEAFRIPVLGRILPLPSYRSAEFMQHEVPGVSVARDVLERMSAAESRGRAREEGIQIARETIAAVRPLLRGILVVLPPADQDTLTLLRELLA